MPKTTSSCKEITYTFLMMDPNTSVALRSVLAAGFILYRRIPPENRIEYLLVQSSSGKWGTAKGHVEAGETDYQAAKRETKEEVGLEEGKDFKVIPDFKCDVKYEVNNSRDGNKMKVVTLWLAEVVNIQCVVTILPEHYNYKWLELKDAICFIGKRIGYKDWVSCLEKCQEKIQST